MAGVFEATGKEGKMLKQQQHHLLSSICVFAFGPGKSWAAGAPDWKEYLPGHGNEKWVEDPWVWAGSQSPPGS